MDAWTKAAVKIVYGACWVAVAAKEVPQILNHEGQQSLEIEDISVSALPTDIF